VEAIKTYIITAVTGKLTQHTLSSVLVETLPKDNSTVTANDEHININSTTYLVANFFGQGNLTGSLLVYVPPPIRLILKILHKKKRILLIRDFS
ncbi:MAG: hypothetical protein Q9169_008089, partial [Polycauliona sp. 2 TL-2023]